MCVCACVCVRGVEWVERVERADNLLAVVGFKQMGLRGVSGGV